MWSACLIVAIGAYSCRQMVSPDLASHLHPGRFRLVVISLAIIVHVCGVSPVGASYIPAVFSSDGQPHRH